MSSCRKRKLETGEETSDSGCDITWQVNFDKLHTFLRDQLIVAHFSAIYGEVKSFVRATLCITHARGGLGVLDSPQIPKYPSQIGA